MKPLFSNLLLLSLLLGCYEGHIALWQEGMQEPEAIYPYSVSSLPPADQDALKKGIPIGSAEELARRLEDYLS